MRLIVWKIGIDTSPLNRALWKSFFDLINKNFKKSFFILFTIVKFIDIIYSTSNYINFIYNINFIFNIITFIDIISFIF